MYKEFAAFDPVPDHGDRDAAELLLDLQRLVAIFLDLAFCLDYLEASAVALVTS